MKLLAKMKMYRLVRVLLPLLVLFPAASGGHVLAQPEQTIAAEWEITFEVRNGAIEATWIGRVWDLTVEPEALKAQRRVPISSDCEVFGDPIFGADDVTLDGVDDYITCRVPNLGALFGTMDPSLVNCRCVFNGPPYAAGDVSPVYSTSPMPVVYLRNLLLEVTRRDMRALRMPIIKTSASPLLRRLPRVDANHNLAQGQLTLIFHDGSVRSWQTNLFSSWQLDGFQLWAGYNAPRYIAINSQDGFAKFLADAGFWEDVKEEFSEGFFFWESEAQAKYLKEEMPAEFRIQGGTLVYIGHNPETDSYFEGVIRAVSIDPGCRGH